MSEEESLRPVLSRQLLEDVAPLLIGGIDDLMKDLPLDHPDERVLLSIRSKLLAFLPRRPRMRQLLEDARPLLLAAIDDLLWDLPKNHHDGPSWLSIRRRLTGARPWSLETDDPLEI